MAAPDSHIDPVTGRPWTPAQRLLRSLARRLPRTARAVHWTRAKARHYAGRAWHRVLRVGRSARWAVRSAGQLLALRREPRATIAVDVTPFWEPLTGIGWYLCRILEQLANRPDLALRLYGPTIVDSPDRARPVVPLPVGPAIEERLWIVPDDLAIPAGWVIRVLRRLEPMILALEGNRVLFAPNFYMPRRFAFARGLQVSTIHDLGVRKVPWTLQSETLEALEARLERSARRSRLLISVSGAVKGELVELGLAPAQKVRVVHHGPGQLAAVAPTGLPAGVPEHYGLHVGTLEPRKNILVLLEAWQVLRRRNPDAPPLVLCGKYGWRSTEIEQAVRAAQDEGWVVHPGYVGEGELAALYRQAAVVVFPTLYEGFGLPAVEAQHAGAPLVCSDLPVLREVAGEGALYAPAHDATAMALAIHRVLTDTALRESLTAAGALSARRLSWAEAARRTSEVWLEAMG
jgi:alpha-1,3-rhamnosyl/mannosyltransferase